LESVEAMGLSSELKGNILSALQYVKMESLGDFFTKRIQLIQDIDKRQFSIDFAIATDEVIAQQRHNRILLERYDNILFCCIMRQINEEELDSFKQAIEYFDQQQDLQPSLSEIKSLYATRNNLMKVNANGTNDFKTILGKFSWTLHEGISLLLHTPLQPTFGANVVLFQWLLKANHFPVTVQDVPGDGNCLLYATQVALQSVDVVGNTDKKIFSQALRWLLFQKAVHLDVHSSEVELGKKNYAFCDGDICMPIMSHFFGINTRILFAQRHQDNHSWTLQCRRFTFKSDSWNAWVGTTSLAGKVPYLEWDPVDDSEAIETFKTNGGASAFVNTSLVEFDGSALTIDASHCHDLTKVVSMLLGHFDDGNPIDDQLIIAFVHTGTSGHFSALLPLKASYPTNVIADTKRDEIRRRINLILQKAPRNTIAHSSSSSSSSSSQWIGSMDHGLDTLRNALEANCSCSARNCNRCSALQLLTEEQLQLFRERMATDLNPELIKSLKTFATSEETNILFTLDWYPVTPMRLSRLASNKWIDNETINFTMDLLATKHSIRKREKPSLTIHILAENKQLERESTWNAAFDVTFRGERVRRNWKLKTADFDKIYIPFHQNKNHWILGIVDIGKSTIRIFDSLLHSDNTNFESALLKWVELELRAQEQSFDASSWNITHEEGPKQNNSYDCGLFVLAAAEMEMMGIGHIYDQSMMSYLRLRVGCEILACRLQSIDELTIVTVTSNTKIGKFRFRITVLFSSNIKVLITFFPSAAQIRSPSRAR
jgi:hypothetical protein